MVPCFLRWSYLQVRVSGATHLRVCQDGTCVLALFQNRFHLFSRYVGVRIVEPQPESFGPGRVGFMRVDHGERLKRIHRQAFPLPLRGRVLAPARVKSRNSYSSSSSYGSFFVSLSERWCSLSERYCSPCERLSSEKCSKFFSQMSATPIAIVP